MKEKNRIYGLSTADLWTLKNPMKMKTIQSFLLILFTLLSLYSCNQQANADGIDTSTVEGKKTLLKNKRQELNNLKAEIKQIEKDILAADPDAFGKKKKPVLVTTKKTQKKDFEEFVEIQGTIETKGEYTATSQIPGTITSMKFKEGDKIRKGQLIATIDNQSFSDSKGEIEVQLQLARDIFEKRARLWEQKIGSEIEYLTAKNNVEALEKSLESLGTQTNKSNVYAPASGMVEMVNLNQGELASPGVPILTIISLKDVQVVADVAENYLPMVKEGDEIFVHLPALDLDREARITNIGARINPANRTFKIEANVSNKDGKLKPNLMTMIRIQQFEEKDAIVVPTNIILQDGDEEFIYIVEQTPKGKFAKKQVIERGQSFKGETQVISGLTGDEVFIAEGFNKVKEGDLLRVRN